MPASQEELNALQYAIKLEQDGRAYYLEAEKKTTHPLVIETFKWLASWELEHIRYIEQFYDALQKDTDTVQLEKLLAKVPSYKEMAKNVFEIAREKIDQTFTMNTEITDVYNKAKDLEDKAAAYYQEQVNKAKDKRARKLFEFLVSQERDHFRILDNSYRYIANPELWHAEEEGWMFDGG